MTLMEGGDDEIGVDRDCRTIYCQWWEEKSEIERSDVTTANLKSQRCRPPLAGWTEDIMKFLQLQTKGKVRLRTGNEDKMVTSSVLIGDDARDFVDRIEVNS
ncbi:hypothetical protein MSG28_009798 [Choristoneura fumiferana]|uniref:Uncharacterized protein n=1 Tax=Choristoneura fumiferana TaxID=7141 RepID=A0ACC0JCR3_CHOFU|nr:hypothetical protein MSG28_009798 [Choristoneura fumiferana]